MILRAKFDRNPNGQLNPTDDRPAARWIRTGLAALFMALPLAGACSSSAPTVKVAEPVGPSPMSPSFFDQGRLVVHTDLTGDRNHADGSGYPVPTASARAPYKIYDLDGYEVRSVDNDGTNTDPEAVTLRNGDYLVRAKGLGGKLVDVKVRVERGKTTEVFLDGSQPPADVASDSLVRTSDGTVIGWRAAPANTAIGGGPREEGLPRFKSMGARIGSAMCDHAMRCGQVGPNQKYATRAECVSKVHSAKRSEYPHSSCVEVSQMGFRDCIAAIRAEECRIELDSPADIAACRAENVCRK